MFVNNSCDYIHKNSEIIYLFYPLFKIKTALENF